MVGSRSGLVGLAVVVLACGSASGQEAKVEFNRDIRPILANHCFVCHGPDNNLRKGKLRLDQEKDGFGIHGGGSVLVPGKAAESELFQRVSSANPAKRMPPVKHNKDLSKDQVELIRRWIDQGATYQKHWSLIAPTRPTPPIERSPWVRNPIDAFILARLDKEGVKPAPEADRRILLRRLSFDLTGLPPTPAEFEAFQKDQDPRAYEKVVDRLLASKQYGERMALYWLDLVRYADTAGYHSDNHRDVWMYRDWVIDAFNRNLPFDRFAREQLAGDLLANPTPEQRVASGYNRLLQTTEEGGAQAKEYIAKYFSDRVRNVSTVWLGLTLGCCECHDHKFDPFSTKEFYQFGSFFADLQERAVGRQDQTPIFSKEQIDRLKHLEDQIGPLEKVLKTATPELAKAQEQWEKEALGLKGLPKDIPPILKIESKKRTPPQQQALAAYYRTIAPALAQPRQQLADFQKQKGELQKTVPSTLVSMAGAPRPIRVLPRGNWLDDSGALVEPGTPSALPSLQPGKGRATRLDLANWITAPDNPLTARVFVNRLWMLMVGQGLVKTLDDFGAQGSWPTHPELLDWLALEFRESGWDVKHLLKLIALSSTYRQSSQTAGEAKQRDPYNQLLARQGRYRLDAEMVRDNALAISGLLNKKIGGPSTKPYQPAGYWRYLNFPTREWANDKNENQYRRGLYTYWQRTFLHPSLLAFDASTREECTVERPRSNTPQQALVLLNDPTYVEAARAFAERILREGGDSLDQRVVFAFREALNRAPRAEESRLLANLQRQHRQQYNQDKKAADLLLRVGERPVPADLVAAELAAWTSVARVIFNLHETITRE